jgi:hypothetical protein
MSTLDTLAQKAEAASKRFAGEGGLKGKLASELAEDAAFLRQLKPSLIAQRARGAAPTDLEPGEAPRAPSGPQLGSRPGRPRSGPNPFLIVGVALVAGVGLAKWIDWRGHAHPRW